MVSEDDKHHVYLLKGAQNPDRVQVHLPDWQAVIHRKSSTGIDFNNEVPAVVVIIKPVIVIVMVVIAVVAVVLVTVVLEAVIAVVVSSTSTNSI